MAVYKIFPEKDNYISSINPKNNYGRDEILELSSGDNISRILIKFPQEELLDVIDKSSGSFQSNLKMYLAGGYYPVEFNVDITPLSQSWDMGTGRDKDTPNPQNGSCWDQPLNISSSWDYWNTMPNIYKISQSFNYNTFKDINKDVTHIVEGWYSGDINNNGFLIKFPQNLESSSFGYYIQYFSIDTHTIYPPQLEIYWNDVNYSSSLSIINSSNFITKISNLQKEYTEGEKYKFIIKNRDLYPTRNFQTSSLYLNNKILPEESWWCLKDVKTEEIVINYHDIGTKIGADNSFN